MAESHAHFRRQSHKDAKARVHRAGGGHADISQDKEMIKKAFRQHENAEHGGKHSPLKLLKGGSAEGHKSKHGRKHRASGGRIPKVDDSMPPSGATEKGGREVDPAAESRAKSDKHGGGRYTMASGGAAKPKRAGGNKTHHTTVNIISPPAAPHPMTPPGAGPVGMPPRPPMAPPGAGAMPPGGPPGGGALPPRPPIMPPGAGAPPIGAGVPMHAAGGRIGRARGGEVHMSAGSKSGVGRLEKEHAAAKEGPMKENKGETADFEDKGSTTTTARRRGGRA